MEASGSLRDYAYAFFIGIFGLNFPIIISTMSVKIFNGGSAQYGLLTSIMAVGSVTGALLSARRSQPNILLMIGAAALFGCGFSLAAGFTNYWLFALTLAIIGISAQTFSTTAISLVQLSTDSSIRGRVMAIFLAIALGSTPVGAPLVGWVAWSAACTLSGCCRQFLRRLCWNLLPD